MVRTLKSPLQQRGGFFIPHVAMRTIEQPIPFIQQGSRPWCWAACCAMAIGYYKPAKYAPTMARIVEFAKLQPAGACTSHPPADALSGEYLHMMQLAIARLGQRKTMRSPPLSAQAFFDTLAADDVVIVAVPGHVMVGSGVRFPKPVYAAMEVRVHDPAEPEPFWTRYVDLSLTLTDCLVVHGRQYV